MFLILQDIFLCGEEMENEEEEIPELKGLYFDLQAEFGSTNHMGGLKATKDLIALCHIGKDAHVLDVGCGVGITASFLAKEYDCRVVGIDISSKMINRSYEKARKENVQEKIEFTVADLQSLPFKNNTFDAVIGESVTAFIQDKQRAVTEYARVTKSGGYIGLNETTWIEEPPAEVADYLLHTTGADLESSETWKELLESSGLHNIVAAPCKIVLATQFINEMKMAGFDICKAWGRVFSLYFKSPTYRKAIKEMAREAWNRPKNIFKYFGYGLYVGKK
jgi:arsenite methyltransferase